MGIFIHLSVSKSVTEDEWASVYRETLRLVEAFPFAEMLEISAGDSDSVRKFLQDFVHIADPADHAADPEFLCLHLLFPFPSAGPQPCTGIVYLIPLHPLKGNTTRRTCPIIMLRSTAPTLRLSLELLRWSPIRK